MPRVGFLAKAQVLVSVAAEKRNLQDSRNCRAKVSAIGEMAADAQCAAVAAAKGVVAGIGLLSAGVGFGDAASRIICVAATGCQRNLGLGPPHRGQSLAKFNGCFKRQPPGGERQLVQLLVQRFDQDRVAIADVLPQKSACRLPPASSDQMPSTLRTDMTQG